MLEPLLGLDVVLEVLVHVQLPLLHVRGPAGGSAAVVDVGHLFHDSKIMMAIVVSLTYREIRRVQVFAHLEERLSSGTGIFCILPS